MAVYVDDVRHQFGRMVMCHLWADSLDELLAMVDAIGVQRKWIQGHPTLSFGKHKKASWVHFDIALSKKEAAIKLGAILTDRFGPVEHVARLDIASGDDRRIARGARMLNTVRICRNGKGRMKMSDSDAFKGCVDPKGRPFSETQHYVDRLWARRMISERDAIIDACYTLIEYELEQRKEGAFDPEAPYIKEPQDLLDRIDAYRIGNPQVPVGGSEAGET